MIAEGWQMKGNKRKETRKRWRGINTNTKHDIKPSHSDTYTDRDTDCDKHIQP